MAENTNETTKVETTKVETPKAGKVDTKKFIERKLKVINQIQNKALAAKLAEKVLANRKA